MSEEYMDIQVYSDDNKEQYVKYGDLLELIERLKIKKEKQDKEIERLNNIINKGIEYIEERYNGEVLTHTFDKDNVGELLNILKGVDKE